MSDTRASMMATLADIRSKKPTPGRQAAAARIEAALGRMSDYAARAPKGGKPVRAMTIHDRERLMKVADDGRRSQAERDRATRLLDQRGQLREGDIRFIDRTRGGD